jgi:hypothetical protein
MEDLENYIPKNSLSQINKWIKELNINVKKSIERKTKLGDFRCTSNGKYIISINKNLNKYSFLITLTHEIAHAFVYDEYFNKVNPHGIEWKITFRKMMINFLHPNIFPRDIMQSLSIHLKNPKASTINDYNLSKALRLYDKDPKTILDEIPNGSIFYTSNGRKFQKLGKIRTRYKCKEISSNNIYLFNALAIVNISNDN